MFKRLFFITIILFSWPINANARLKSLVKERLESGTILVVKQDKILLDEAYGYADREKLIENTPSTQFLIGSITKQFTASAIVKLAEQGLLHLDRTLLTYLPNYKAKWAGQVTIHQLLTHSSGVPNYLKSPGFSQAHKSTPTSETLINLIKDMDLNFKPGAKFEYSGSGYNILGAVIENITSLPYGVYLEKEIFHPLNMSSTLAPHMHLLSQVRGLYPKTHIAHSYRKNNKNFKKVSDVNLSIAFSEASIISTTHDIYKWQQALYKGKIVSELFLSKMLKNHNGNYGYGISIDGDLSKYRTYHHTGRMKGYESIALYQTRGDIHIIILSNIAGTDVYNLAKDILELLNKA